MKFSYIILSLFISQTSILGSNVSFETLHIESDKKLADSTAELFKKEQECWRNIAFILKKIKDAQSAKEYEAKLISELAHMDNTIYLLNRRNESNNVPERKYLEIILKENEAILKEVSGECARLHENNNFENENIAHLLMQENRRVCLSPILEKVAPKYNFLKKLNKDDLEMNKKSNEYILLLLSFEDFLRDLNSLHLKEKESLLRTKMKAILPQKKEIMALAKGEYQSNDKDFSFYLRQKVVYTLNDAIDQYIILKKHHFFNSKELEESMKPFEEFANEFYKDIIGESFEKEYLERYSLLELTKKGFFYENKRAR